MYTVAVFGLNGYTVTSISHRSMGYAGFGCKYTQLIAMRRGREHRMVVTMKLYSLKMIQDELVTSGGKSISCRGHRRALLLSHRRPGKGMRRLSVSPSSQSFLGAPPTPYRGARSSVALKYWAFSRSCGTFRSCHELTCERFGRAHGPRNREYTSGILADHFDVHVFLQVIH